MKPLLSCLSVLVFLAVSSGCASPWQANFEPNSELGNRKFPPTKSVEVRSIEFERLQQYARDERQRRIESSVAPQDLPLAERVEAKNRLLETLQLRERGDEVHVLGWSEFISHEKLDPNGRPLTDFARKIGADYVVVASNYAGRVAQTVERPMTSYYSGHALRGRRGGRVVSYSETATTWVPTTELVDQFFYTAVFLRKSRPGE